VQLKQATSTSRVLLDQISKPIFFPLLSNNKGKLDFTS
jgi:hypothetical protein